MSKAEITFKDLQDLVRKINSDCKQFPEDEKLQEKRRALLEVRRAINGKVGITPEKLLAYIAILSEAKRDVAKKLEELGLDIYSLQNLQLADDMDEVVLEISTIEEEIPEGNQKEIDRNKE